eukprot:355608_1
MDQQQAHAEKMNMDHQQAEIKSAASVRREDEILMNQQQAHAEKMNMDHQQAEIKSAASVRREDEILMNQQQAHAEKMNMQKMQERTIVDIRVAKEKEDQLQENYLRHKAKHEEDLAVIVKKIELAQLKYAESNDKIRDVINR